MFTVATPFKCTNHTYDSIHVVTQDETFTASSCSYCMEHKVITFIRKLFKL